MKALWKCPCGTVARVVERFRDDPPRHFRCGEMVYIKDVPDDFSL